VVRWRRRSAWLWIIGRLFAVFGLLWVGRRLGRGVDGGESRAIAEFGCAVAPLVLFALFWLLADSA
jgi:drug/metabolite transporter (DMT)-like permease